MKYAARNANKKNCSGFVKFTNENELYPVSGLTCNRSCENVVYNNNIYNIILIYNIICAL